MLATALKRGQFILFLSTSLQKILSKYDPDQPLCLDKDHTVASGNSAGTYWNRKLLIKFARLLPPPNLSASPTRFRRDSKTAFQSPVSTIGRDVPMEICRHLKNSSWPSHVGAQTDTSMKAPLSLLFLSGATNLPSGSRKIVFISKSRPLRTVSLPISGNMETNRSRTHWKRAWKLVDRIALLHWWPLLWDLVRWGRWVNGPVFKAIPDHRHSHCLV